MNAEPTPPLWPLHPTEDARLEDLRSLEMMDTPNEEPYDGIVEVAAALFETPIALLTLLDSERQWFKASVGVPVCSTHRADALCNHTIIGSKTLVVNDTTRDHRFKDHRFVVGEPHLRFYAGTPLISDREQAVGTLCVLDVRPREFDAARYRLLERLARQAVEALESRRLIQTLLSQCIETEGRAVVR